MRAEEQEALYEKQIQYFFMLTFSTLLIAAGTYFFKFTNNFTFGGITGLAVLVAKTGIISAGDFNLIMSMILLVIGLIILGKGFAAKTAYCSILLSVALSAMGTLFPHGPSFYRPAYAGTVFCNCTSGSGFCHPL